MEPRSNRSSRHGSQELNPGAAIPLIDFSRTPSPSNFSRTRSATQSEDEDEYEFEAASTIRPLVAQERSSGKRRSLGSYWFGTWAGWQVYVGVLVLWVLVWSVVLVLMNRFILLTGVYKFPYPLTATYIQLIICHLVLVGFASLTRGASSLLRKLGLAAMIAPIQPVPSSVPGHRGASMTAIGLLHKFFQWLRNGSGGIAGGGLFECDRRVAKQVLPLAVIYVAKVILSNLSYAYAMYPVYQLARIGVVPISLLLTSILARENHSVATLSSSLIATLNLLLASIRPGMRVTWESIVAGIFSSFFVALYPILLLRTYRSLVADLVPQGDILTGFPATSNEDTVGTREETRAYWRILHYTSLLSIAVLTPLVLVSGELTNMLRNCYICDVPFLWFLHICGGVASWAVFSTTLLLIKATSVTSAAFLAVPRGAFQLMVLSLFRMPVHSWVGVALCWVTSLWFLRGRREEGRVVERWRLEGR